VVYYGRVLGVYSSWKEVGPLVNRYENNLHKGYTAMKEAEESHSKFVSQQVGYYVPPRSRSMKLHQRSQVMVKGAASRTLSSLSL
jgi:hypothetical protein